MKLHRWAAATTLSLATLAAWAQDTVVYHVSDTATQALAGLRNVKNHLDTDPAARISVVTHANGVDFLMQDAMDRNGNPYEIIAEAGFTPSGVVRIAKLQQQGAAYIRP
jgi:intracellular sulfur oxidation DsrE/DsrF family protein